MRNKKVTMNNEPLTLNPKIMELYHHRELIGSLNAFAKAI